MTEDIQKLNSSEPPIESKKGFWFFLWKHKCWTFFFLIILSGSILYLNKTHSLEKDYQTREEQIKEKAKAKIERLTNDRWSDVATVFSWAVRGELIRDNLEQVDILFSELIRTDDIQKLQLFDAKTGKVRLSTDKKDVGLNVLDYNSYQQQTVKEEDGGLIIITPIYGLSKKVGIVVMHVQSKI